MSDSRSSTWLELPELSPRELAGRFTDEKQYFVSDDKICRSNPRSVKRFCHRTEQTLCSEFLD